MSKELGAVLALLVLATGSVAACEMDVPGRPSAWTQQIDKAGLVFVGHVVRIKPNTQQGLEEKVVFRVETKVRGRLGDHVIFAGDSIWDPTVLLSEPLTPAQELQLQYVQRIAEGR